MATCQQGIDFECAVTINCKDCIVSLLRGTGAQMTKSQIEARTGIPTREVERAIQELSIDGEPIISGAHGYRVTRDPDEMRRQAERQRDRCKTMFRRFRGNHAAVRKLEERE